MFNEKLKGNEENAYEEYTFYGYESLFLLSPGNALMRECFSVLEL